MAMDPNDSMNPDRFSAILENQRAIMVNQATILHNQNKIMRGMEQLFSYFPALQGSLTGQSTLPTPVNVVPISSILGNNENTSRVEQPPSATQLTADQTSSVSPSPRVENTTPINTPTRPQAPLNSNTPAMVANSAKTDSSPNSDNETDVPATPLARKGLSDYITQEELAQIKCKSCSIGNFAVQLLRHIFDHSELENRNCTGTRGKEPVDPDRLRFVKETVYDVYAISADDKINTWKHCIRAIDEYLRRPKRIVKRDMNKTAMF